MSSLKIIASSWFFPVEGVTWKTPSPYRFFHSGLMDLVLLLLVRFLDIRVRHFFFFVLTPRYFSYGLFHARTWKALMLIVLTLFMFLFLSIEANLTIVCRVIYCLHMVCCRLYMVLYCCYLSRWWFENWMIVGPF